MSIPSQDTSISYEQLNSSGLEYIQAELSNWERIVFEGTVMDGSHNQGDRSSDSPHSSADNVGIYPPGHLLSGAAPPHVPPEAYTYLIHALLSMQGVLPPPPAHNNQSVPFSQVRFPGPSTSSVSPHVPHQVMHSHSPLVMPSTGYVSPSNAQAIETPHSASFHANPPSDAGDTADEAAIVAEDKRRRNTSASARFRIKKKQKSLNLERTVADLTGRTEELEREASNLRRENSWLKEIVLLKSRRVDAFGGSQSSSSQQPNTPSTQGNGDKKGLGSDMKE